MVEDNLMKFLVTNSKDGADKAIDQLMDTIGDNEAKRQLYKEMVAKMLPDVKEKFADRGLAAIGNLSFFNDDHDEWLDALDGSADTAKEVNAKVAEKVADEIKDKAEEVAKSYEFSTNYAGPAPLGNR